MNGKQKTEMLYFRADPELKTKIEFFAEQLNLTISGLVRESIDHYAKAKHGVAYDGLWLRMSKVLAKIHHDRVPEADVEAMRGVLSEMTIAEMETLSNPILVSDESFHAMIASRVHPVEPESVTA